jgi:predicted nucleic acid-binding protein
VYPKYQRIAPTLFYYEITNAFHRYARYGELTPEEAEEGLEYSLSLEIEFYRNTSLHRKAFNLAKNLALPAAYDAHYLALAQEFLAEFYTADRRLFNAVNSIYPWVKLAS